MRVETYATRSGGWIANVIDDVGARIATGRGTTTVAAVSDAAADLRDRAADMLAYASEVEAIANRLDDLTPPDRTIKTPSAADILAGWGLYVPDGDV